MKEYCHLSSFQGMAFSPTFDHLNMSQINTNSVHRAKEETDQN